MRRGRVTDLVGLALWAGLSAGVPVSVGAENLEEKIDRAAELNVTAPREVSKSLLDELLSELDRATPRQRARIILLQARHKALSGDYQGAIDDLAPIRESDLPADLKLRAFRLSANSALNRDRFEEGYRFLRQGLELVPQVEPVEPKTKLLSLAAYFYSMAGEAEKAIEFAGQALDLARSSGDHHLDCIALNDLALARTRAGKLETALETRRQGLEACRDAGDPILEGVVTNALADLRLDMGTIDDVIPMIRDSIQQLDQAGFRDGVLNARLTLARALVANGDVQEADSILGSLVSEFEKVRFWRNLRDAHQLLARITEGRGQYAAALEHHRAADEAGKKLLDRERAMRLAYLQVEFDMRRKEQQIELLQEQNRVLELRQESQRQRRYLAFGGVAAASVIVLLLLSLLARTRSDRRHLLWLSQHDGLTGLRNHSSFFRRANEALAVCRKADQPFTLVVADIDFFKQINDEHGHDVGDRVLHEIGELLRSVFWPQGIVGRIGGEEFGMALPGIDRDQARDLIDEFNARLAPLTKQGAVIHLTMSYGIAETQDEISVERLRRFGDQALYEAKRRGRNCIVDAAEVTEEATVQVPMNRRADDPA